MLDLGYVMLSKDKNSREGLDQPQGEGGLEDMFGDKSHNNLYFREG